MLLAWSEALPRALALSEARYPASAGCGQVLGWLRLSCALALSEALYLGSAGCGQVLGCKLVSNVLCIFQQP